MNSEEFKSQQRKSMRSTLQPIVNTASSPLEEATLTAIAVVVALLKILALNECINVYYHLNTPTFLG